MKSAGIACFLILNLLLAGCAHIESASAPDLPLPAAWLEPAEETVNCPENDWWGLFGSATLSALIADAQRANPDVFVALERVRQAEIALRVAGSSLFPSLAIDVGTSQRRTDPAGDRATTSSSTGLSLGAAYEVDVWGKLAAQINSAQHGVKASRHDFDSVRLSLAAAVATGYFQVLALDARLGIANENLSLARRVLQLVEARHQAGVASDLDLSRQRTTVISQRNSIVSLEGQRHQAVYALAVLLGEAPQNFAVATEIISALTPVPVSPGLPAQLLVRRPDLARVEAELAAANADIAAARAALLPSIRLSTSAGIASGALLSLGNPSASIGVSASIVRAIFDGGRLRSQVELADSRRRVLVENYRHSILIALSEVEVALSTLDRSGKQMDLQVETLTEARRTLILAELRYREGADDLFSILDAQRTLFQAQDQMAQLQFTRLAATVDLYKSLGGGWSHP